MKNLLVALLLITSLSAASAFSGVRPAVVYWDTDAGKVLRSRISPNADYWQLSPNFAVQMTQSYCSVASAITVLNALPIGKPVDPTYAPYGYFTQSNFFTPEVSKIIDPQTVLAMGMTREEMVATLTQLGVKATSIAGDTLDDAHLRIMLQKTLEDDGQFVLANYLRANLDQVGGGHWSVLAAYDAESDSVLILDVAKYKYPPAWVRISTLRLAIATIDPTSNKARGLVIISK